MPVAKNARRRAKVVAKSRLRRDVYDQLVAERGVPQVKDQTELTGLSRRTLTRLRKGEPPGHDTAMVLAEALGVPVGVLFERVKP